LSSDTEVERMVLAGLRDVKRGLKHSLILTVLFMLVFLAVVLPLIISAFGRILEASGLPEEELAKVVLEALRTVIFVVVPINSIFVVALLFIYLREFIPGLGKLKSWRPEFRMPYLLITFSVVVGGALSLVSAAVLPIYISTMSPRDLLKVINEFGVQVSAFPGIEVFGGLTLLKIVSQLLEFVGFAGYASVCYALHQVFGDYEYDVAGALFVVSIILGALVALGVQWLSLIEVIVLLVALILLYVALSTSIEKLEMKAISLLGEYV